MATVVPMRIDSNGDMSKGSPRGVVDAVAISRICRMHPVGASVYSSGLSESTLMTTSSSQPGIRAQASV